MVAALEFWTLWRHTRTNLNGGVERVEYQHFHVVTSISLTPASDGRWVDSALSATRRLLTRSTIFTPPALVEEEAFHLPHHGQPELAGLLPNFYTPIGKAWRKRKLVRRSAAVISHAPDIALA